jgi:hypothetical protein
MPNYHLYIAMGILMFQVAVLYQFLWTTLTLKPISAKYYSLVILSGEVRIVHAEWWRTF